jgi:predicted amidohydrolase
VARIIAAAQYAAVSGNFDANLERHLRYATAAAALGVKLLVFPEMSLTGYDLPHAAELAVNPYAPCFEPLKAIAREAGMTILAGAPLRIAASELHIGQIAVLPDGMVAIYTKRHIPQDEIQWIKPGQGGPILRMGGLLVAMAICADITHADHAANAAAHKANVYAASVLLRDSAYAKESAMLQGYARTHAMTVLMANHSAPTCGWIPAGRSAIWDEQGSLIAASPGAEESLILARRRGKTWEGAVFPLKAPLPPAIITRGEPSTPPPPAPSFPDQGHLFTSLKPDEFPES